MSPTESVSSLAIINMGISAVLSLLVPIALIIVMGIKKRLNWKAALFGALLFVVFAMILERIMHVLVLGVNPANSFIYKNTVLYMLYGGFAAGIFEETARLICFKSILKVNESFNVNTGISYGLGHGGIEAVLLGGLGAVGNITTSVMINSGMTKQLTAALSGEQLEQFNNGIDALISAPSYMFLVSGFERMIALGLQVALSLFVFKAVAEKKWQYFVYAILIHAGIDMVAVLFQKGVIKSIFLVEGAVLVSTIAVALVAFKISKRKPILENVIEG